MPARSRNIPYWGKNANYRRARRAGAILTDYRRRFDRNEDWETVITNLVADVMHFARMRSKKIDVDAALGKARYHFDAEVREEIERHPIP